MNKFFYVLAILIVLFLAGCEKNPEKKMDISNIPGEYLFTMDATAAQYHLSFVDEPVILELASNGQNGATFRVNCKRTASESTIMLYNPAIGFYWAHSYVLNKGAAVDGNNQALNVQTTFNYMDGNFVVVKNDAQFLNGTLGYSTAKINKIQLIKR